MPVEALGDLVEYRARRGEVRQIDTAATEVMVAEFGPERLGDLSGDVDQRNPHAIERQPAGHRRAEHAERAGNDCAAWRAHDAHLGMTLALSIPAR